MPRKQHTHKYVLRPTGSNSVWACALDNCYHYMPHHLTPLLEGRFSLCFKCEDRVRMDSDLLEWATKENSGKILCEACRGISLVSISDMNVPEPKRAKEIIQDNPIAPSITEIMQKMAADEAKENKRKREEGE
jgi:hypothetical protein